MRDFKIGDVLYHRTDKTRGVIKEESDKYIKLVFDHFVGGNEEIEFTKASVGEFLFYSEDQINLPIEELATLNEYSHSKRVIKFKEKQKIKNISIKEVLKRRNINNLVHFTRIENLESILNKGFIPREQLEKRNVCFYKNDSIRRDGKTDCTCFSVEFPNCYLFKNFRNRDVDSKWAVILVDSKILLENDRKKYFCYHNAARSDIRYKLYNEELRNVKDFENLFCEVQNYIRNVGSGTKHRQSIPGIRDYLPTDAQAEILISEVIPNSYIKSVNFINEEDLKFFNKSILDKKNNLKIEFDVKIDYFLDREEVNFPERCE